MKFNNKPNTVHQIDGKMVWESRSVAMNTVIIAIDITNEQEQEPYVLISQRGTGAPDYNGYWNIPAGYLDKNETCSEGAIREVWEETNINIHSILNMEEDGENFVVCDHMGKEWGTNSEITNNKQNVSFRFGVYFVMKDFMDKIELSDKNSEPNEVEDIKWILLSDVDNYKFAFNHDKLIKEFVDNYAND